MNTNISERAAKIRLAIFDVDGVLTDGRLILGSDGSEYKSFHVRDGLGLVLLREAGIQVAVISARASSVTADRMAALGIEYVYQGQSDKAATYAELTARLKVTAEQTAYVGDDLIDLPVLRQVGLAVAVSDADPLLRAHVHWVTAASGGRGAVREVCEAILMAQGHWAGVIERYLQTGTSA